MGQSIQNGEQRIRGSPHLRYSLANINEYTSQLVSGAAKRTLPMLEIEHFP